MRRLDAQEHMSRQRMKMNVCLMAANIFQIPKG